MVWIQFAFDECLRRVDEDVKDVYQAQSNGSPFLVGRIVRNRYKYVVTRDTAFEFESRGDVIRGVIQRGFLCDGFSLPLMEPFNTLMDRAWFGKWLIHDWLMSYPYASVNGIKQRVDIFQMSQVFGGLTQVILFLAAFVVSEKKTARSVRQRMSRDSNIMFETTRTLSKLLLKTSYK